MSENIEVNDENDVNDVNDVNENIDLSLAAWNDDIIKGLPRFQAWLLLSTVRLLLVSIWNKSCTHFEKISCTERYNYNICS